ncbi:hypothetical protein EZS27_000332 [termite gut metagenome]|jgi:predicted peptidase|uniref:Phospholipase/carboxylesterase/thioesterase domain-containing protein n=1 Tax=termite gut metagenome TaxID=433724 RepID=A0A5J4T383_9ZZZZ
MKQKILAFIFIFFNTTICVFAQFENGLFMQNGFSLPYKISFPDNYDQTKQYPLIIFLHGAGERGNDNEKQLTHGKTFLLENTKSKYPAIVIAPQCPENNYWANVRSHTIKGERTFAFGINDEPTMSMKTLMYLIEDWLTSGKINLRQVYIGGLSMGGMGTLELLWRMPDTFAAAFPICGGGSIDKINKYAKTTSVWLFHGDNDGVVPPVNSTRLYDALTQSGCDVKYTEYENVGHNAWDYVFKETELFPWLFSHKQ